jgi:hypothetical protein
VGAALWATGAIGHLSGMIVLSALGAALTWVRRREIDRARSIALVVGLFLAALYYLQFWGLIADQLPRLLEGGGQGRGASRGAGGALLLQLLGAIGQWGPPAMVLALWGRPRPERSGLERDLAAFWVAGLLLAIPAVVSPLDVRYLYALTLPLAVAAAGGFETLAARGAWGRASAWGLLVLQTLQAGRGIVEAILYRYRPG